MMETTHWIYIFIGVAAVIVPWFICSTFSKVRNWVRQVNDAVNSVESPWEGNRALRNRVQQLELETRMDPK